MGIFDKARDPLEKHADQIDPLVDRVAGEVDQRTAGRHDAHLDRGGDPAGDEVAEQVRSDAASRADRTA